MPPSIRRSGRERSRRVAICSGRAPASLRRSMSWTRARTSAVRLESIKPTSNYLATALVIKNLMRSNVGDVGSAVSKMTEEGFRNSILYQEWDHPKGYVVDLFNVTLDRTATAVIHLGFVRHETVGIADGETLRDLSLLFPHYRRAILIGKTIEQTRVEAASLSDVLDGLAASVFLLDDESRLVYINQSGKRMLDDGLVARKNGNAIALCDKAADLTLHQTRAAIASGKLLSQEGIAIAVRGLD